MPDPSVPDSVHPAPNRASSFVAGLLIGVAITSGVAAFLLRYTQNSQPAIGRTSNTTATVRTLRLAHALTTDHPVHLGLERFAELVEERTDGRIAIQLFPNGELGDETTSLEQLQAGTLDIAKASAAPLGAFEPAFGVFSVPYAFHDREHYWAVLDGPVGNEILGLLDTRGLHGLCYFDAGARSFYTAGDPILTPDDVQGLKVRVMESRTAMDMISAYGGAPTPMSFSELYSALQSRLVDAAENNPPSFQASRHYEVARHFTLNEHTRVPDVLLMSKSVWDGLSEPDRRIMTEAAHEASLYQRELWTQRTTAALEAIEQAGVTVHHVDTEPFAAAAEPLRAGYTGTTIGRLLDAIAHARPSQSELGDS